MALDKLNEKFVRHQSALYADHYGSVAYGLAFDSFYAGAEWAWDFSLKNNPAIGFLINTLEEILDDPSDAELKADKVLRMYREACLN